MWKKLYKMLKFGDTSMNLVQFLKKVDKNMSKMTEEQLQFCIHELARTLEEEKRQSFLDTMKLVKEGSFTIQEDKHKKDFCAEIEKIKRVLNVIHAGKKCLGSEYNEEWDEWYNSSVDEFVFSDSKRLLPDIENGIDLLHKCVDREMYQEGCELAELLSQLEVVVHGDYCEYDDEPFRIQGLYEHGLLSGTFEKVVTESLYLSYMGNKLSLHSYY